MGLLDGVISAIGKQLGGGQQNSLIEQVIAMINNPETGGLSGLIEKFQKGGLTDIAASWVGTGENKPVSGDQITNALGADSIKDIAGKLGFSGSQVSDGLASILPQIIDKLTPDGNIPEGNTLEKSIGALAERFLKA